MASVTRPFSPLTWSQATWAVVSCRLLALFVPHALAALTFYVVLGPAATAEDLPRGFQVDRWHGVVHLTVGLLGAYFGFWRPAAALAFLRVFAVVYLVLAVLGTFTTVHLGLELGLEENGLHWVLGLAAAAIGFLPWRPAAAER